MSYVDDLHRHWKRTGHLSAIDVIIYTNRPFHGWRRCASARLVRIVYRYIAQPPALTVSIVSPTLSDIESVLTAIAGQSKRLTREIYLRSNGSLIRVSPSEIADVLC